METVLQNLEQKFVISNRYHPNLMAIFILLGVGLVVLWIRKHKKSSSNEQIHGPGLLNSLKLLFRTNAMRLRLIDEWAKTYKDIFEFKLGPYSIVCLNSPPLIQKLLSSRDSNYLAKPQIYDIFRQFIGDGVLVSEGNKWKSRRKVLNSQIFAYGTLTYYMKLFNEEGDSLVNIFDSLATSPFSAPIDDILLKSSLSAISKILLGQTLNSRDKSSETKIIWMMTKAKEMILTKFCNPLHRSKWLWRLHPMSKVENEAQNFTKELKTSVMNNNFPFQTQLLDNGVPPDEIFNESLNLLTAGFDTTATGLHFLLLILSLHPSHQEKCQQEVDLLFEETDNEISLSALSKLEYLEMCMNEALRLMPVIPGFMRGIKTPLDLGNGQILPANTTVLVYAHGIHMNPEYYPEPQRFMPERFSKAETRKRPAYLSMME
ncbi:Cytochrome P450 4c21 [Orchesella cincta]|uniref:Cytochrome P450 4c21 n=1 Tax=Orchesella cincta TaxID=48709 RepID=A0A1D2MB47_ORCCI|nr:Cytochrome P450 4c21 [Orchesella cincta]